MTTKESTKKNDLFWAEADLEEIPQELCDFSREPKVYVHDIGYGQEFLRNGELLAASSYTVNRLINTDLVAWIKNNIPGIIPEAISYVVTGKGWHIVHSDQRKWSLNYYLDTGGDRAFTHWYQEKGFPRDRQKTVAGWQADRFSVQYQNLDQIEETRFRRHQWYLFNNHCLHDVGPMDHDREFITVALRDPSSVPLR